jgi:hypothetical protein
MIFAEMFNEQSPETEKYRFFGSVSVLKTENRTEPKKNEKIGFLNRNQNRKNRKYRFSKTEKTVFFGFIFF